MINGTVQTNDITDHFAIPRARMVEHLRKHYGIADERVLNAMNRVARHLFVPEAIRSQAYKDNALPIAAKQTISQPYIVARMTELLELKGRERVLEIGSGSGYQTAVLALLARKVFAVERLSSLAAEAKQRLMGMGYRNISYRTADGTEGWQVYAPFDAILVALTLLITLNPEEPEKATAAKLSSQEKDELLAIDQNNYKNIPVKIVLPTYVPDGFKVEEVAVNDDKRFGPSYSIIYFDENNNCFEVSGASGGFGAGAEDFEILTVNSKALGNVELGYTQFDQVKNQPRIGFNQFTVPGVIPSDQQYSFWSPGTVNSQCNAIELQEAAKIVESLDYLNP
ncbi:protein-L-isoaspartate(D-aspartate) O-methyltransferase [Leptolyngbya sp. 7M]|uniref:protein-L-isoaspartate(D-aspartate) O-methyltransferase n=1 Tax=Leptolyngbya sp. 7M TaxID=2812896 RepID=UPI001B8C7085|nr:protein-L-isoaspartate(D-aspartate) O-methyltransferase [Leptolyngbya sp. 7M]QYO62058.1 protein-L-isoaspartate(D-aspartate) O-methyltransferase [Leptolyngbya sp. 7M]